MAATGLIADIGTTRARLAMVDVHGRISSEATVRCAEHADLTETLQAFIGQQQPICAAVAVGTAVTSDEIALPNTAWQFKASSLRDTLGLDVLAVLNDAEAAAYSLPQFLARDLDIVAEGGSPADRQGATASPPTSPPPSHAPQLVIAPRACLGEPLGAAALIPENGGRAATALTSEADQVTLAATQVRDAELLEDLQDQLGHPFAGRVLSGPGLIALYGVFCHRAGKIADPGVTAQAIVARAEMRTDPHAEQALTQLAGLLGTFARNLVLSLAARGGLYLAGDLVNTIGGQFDRRRFLNAFRDGGGVDDVPIAIIRHPSPAFPGLAAIAQHAIQPGITRG